MKQRETFNYFKNKTPGAEGFGKGMAINHQIRWQESSRSFIFNALEEQAQSTGGTERKQQQWQKNQLYLAQPGGTAEHTDILIYSLSIEEFWDGVWERFPGDGANFARVGIILKSPQLQSHQRQQQTGIAGFGWGFQWGKTPALLLDEAGISHGENGICGTVPKIHPPNAPKAAQMCPSDHGNLW